MRYTIPSVKRTLALTAYIHKVLESHNLGCQYKHWVHIRNNIYNHHLHIHYETTSDVSSTHQWRAIHSWWCRDIYVWRDFVTWAYLGSNFSLHTLDSARRSLFCGKLVFAWCTVRPTSGNLLEMRSDNGASSSSSISHSGVVNLSVLFADDSNLFLSDKNVDHAQQIIKDELKVIVSWLRANKLSLNISKTHYMLFSN